ncbi:hypothetical protein JCM10207_005068 [Rhodosporidiobolus poonsookiae]
MGLRRDEALEALDSFTSQLRTQLAHALDPQQTDHRRASRGQRLAGSLARRLDLPPAPSSSQPHNARRPSPSPGRHPAARTVLGGPTSDIPFSGSASHDSVPLPTSSSSSAPPTAGPSSSRGAPPATPGEADGDALPSYSRRAPVPSHLLASLPPKRLHRLTSKTGKLGLEITARGRDHVVLVQEMPDAETNLEGRLKVVLKDPESITHIRVRVKGVIRTLLIKPQSSGRQALNDELSFLSSGRTLWTSTPSNGAPPELLRGNQSSDPTKLHGTFLFPFSLPVPARITNLPAPSTALEGLHPGERLPAPMRPPPSFVLDSDALPAGARTGALGGAGGAFQASCRYYLKVTLGRKGLLKMNERWIVPVVWVPRQVPPPLSLPREVALREGRRIPGSRDDPQGWTEPGRYVVRESVRRGVWKTKAGWVELEGRVPRGKVQRGVGERVEFEVQITSSNPEATGRFLPSSLAVTLIQRTHITAQNQTHAVDLPVVRASSVRPLGPGAGETITFAAKDGGGTGWTMGYAGSLKLTQAVGSSFSAPNLTVSYLLAIAVSAPSSALTVGSSPILATLPIPINIASCAPRGPSAAPGPASSLAADFSPQHGTEVGEPDAPAYASPPQSPPPPLPPRKSPPTASSAFEGAQGLDTALAGPSAASSTPLEVREEASTAQAQVDEDAERRMEDEWGLPPSYFDVVGVEDGRGSGRRR